MHSSDDPDISPVGRSGDSSGSSGAKVAAGFGSPADDATVRRIDLNDVLIRHSVATFMMRASGEGMSGAGISSGDLLIVDRAITARHGHVVIAVVAGELLCRRLEMRDGLAVLKAEAPGHADIEVSPEAPLQVWGVVSSVIKSLLD